MSLGINEKDQIIKNALTVFSRSDFYHDFSKKDTVRSVLDRLVNSRLLGSKLSKNEYIKNLTNLRSKLTGTVYDFFQEYYNAILPIGSKGDSLKEDPLLKNIAGFDYVSLQNTLREFDRLKGLSKNILPEPIELNISYESKINRNYEIRCYPTKIRGTYYNIPHAFSTNTGDSKKFVLIIDASFIIMSSMRLDDMLKNQYIKDYDPSIEYSFYILQSNENSSDPATKIKKFDLGKTKNIHIHYLKDPVGKKVVYPTFDTLNQASNLYSNIELSTVINEDGTVDGILNKGGYERKNIAMCSEINEASFLALQQYLENNNKISEEILSYFFLKKAGDWCQALSLLDMNRTYDVYNEEDTHTGSKTLTDLINEDYTLGIVTHDRILLGYSLLLGLNVFFSMKMVSVDSTDEGVQDGNSVIWLVYFQNLESEIRLDNYAKFINEKDSVIKAIHDVKEEARINIETIIGKLKAIDYTQLTKSILDLRLYISMLIELHTPDEFSIEEYKYIKYFNELNGLEDKRKISRILRGIQECIQLFKKWSLENNMILLKESYPALIQDKARVRNLLDYNSQSSYTAAKIEFNKTMEEIKRDLEELKRKKIILSNLFGNREFIGNRKEAGIYTYIMTKLNTLQSGGNISLQTILLPPNTDSKYINDAEGNFYSVIDSYLVTKIHATFFREYFNINKETQDKYVFFRFFIYYLDELYTELFCLTGEIPYEGGKSQYMEDLFVKFISVYYQLFNIETYYNNWDMPQLANLYYINRHKWTHFYLLGELNHLGRYKELNNYKGISHRITSKLKELHQRIYKDFIGKKRAYKSVLSISPSSLSRKQKKRRKTSITHKLSRST